MTYALAALGLIGVTGWVARDSARRGRSWLGWSVLVFVTGAAGIVAWFIVRTRSPIVTERLGFLRATLLSLIGVPLLLVAFPMMVFVTTFLVQLALVQGHSMEPTLRDGQRVLVNKFAYRGADPRRGDVVMFYYPLRPEKTFAQRVIATEGDTVRIDGGRLFVNLQLVRDDYVQADFRSRDDWGPQVVPEGYYFLMGDHRNQSADSRHWGFVPKKYIIGRIVLRN